MESDTSRHRVSNKLTPSVPDDETILGWDRSDVEKFAASRLDEVAGVIRRLIAIGGDRALTVLCSFLAARGPALDDKPAPSQLAIRGLVLSGPAGIDAFAKALRTERVRYSAKALVVLIRVGKGEGLIDPMGSLRDIPDDFLEDPIPAGTAEAVQRMLSDIASEAVAEVPGALEVLSRVLSESTMLDAGKGTSDAASVVRLLSEASIRLTPAILDDFGKLIEAERTELHYQRFLELHPVLLDPLAAEVVPQQRLGVEYATDFALRRHDGGWTVVEIERPQDNIFTTRDDFSARFTHAYGQVLDFQQWVDQHVAYARELMPGIAVPGGLLVVGMRRPLSPRQANKLKQFADNSRRVDVVTYDELLARGRQLYASLWHHSLPE